MGGMQSHSLNLARYLARRGIEIDLYHVFKGEMSPRAELEAFSPEERKRVSSIFLRWPPSDGFPGHYLRENKWLSCEFLEIMRSRPPIDFVYVQGFLGHSLLQARKLGELSAPVGVNLHGLEMFQPPPSWKAILGQAMMRRRARADLIAADLVFSFGGKIFDLVTREIGVPSDRVAVIPNGVESDWVVEQPARLEPCPLRFVFVGRYERRKAVPEIHQAVTQLPGRERWVFSFIGPIPEENQLRQENVHYHGLVSDRARMKELLDDCDVLVCPSYSEGMPTVILEAMARGLAIMSTDVGAVRSMVCSDNGIVLPKVSVSAIRAGLSRFINMPEEELLAMKYSSLERANEFAWPRVAQLTHEAMERCIHGSQIAPSHW